jgi:cobalt-zinc-cadmium efflux system outer membrane protein
VAELREKVTQLELREAARQLVLDVENAFVEVVLEQGHLHLAQENRDGFNRILRISQERVRAGDLAKVELMRTRLAQLHYDNSVILAQSRLRTAKQRLLLLMGHTGPEMQFEVEGQLPRPSLKRPLSEMEQIAITRRPDYLAILKDQERGEAAIRLEEANGKSDYVAGIEYRRQQGLAGRGNSVGLFFAVPLPIFDTNEGEIERARQEYQQLLARAKALEASIRQQLASALQEYEAAERTVQQIESSMLSQARQVLDTMEYAYRAGHASLVELLDAQRTYNDTVSSYNEALAQYARSRFALEAITGGNP